MKKKIVLIILVVLCVTPMFAAANNDGFGVGLVGGYPSGITASYSMGDFRIVGDLSSYFSGVNIDGGVLFPITDFMIGEAPLYLEAGGLLGVNISSNWMVYVDGLGRLSYYFNEYPIEVFLNVGAGVGFGSGFGVDIKSGIGGLWYF